VVDVAGATLLPGAPLGGATQPTPEALRAAVRERADQGVDVVKATASGGTMTPGTRQEESKFTADLLRAAVDEASVAVGITARGVPGSRHRAAAGSGVADADVVAVNGNPLTDLAALHDIRAVFARGTRVA
jgi:imidazolonepropionase-like amidohydrolase